MTGLSVNGVEILFYGLFLITLAALSFAYSYFLDAFIFDTPDRCLSFERSFFRIFGLGPCSETSGSNWVRYLRDFLLFSFVSGAITYLILRYQAYLPLNPHHLPNLSSDLAINIAISFVTNTDWQAYSGEQTLSYFSQMIGLGIQYFGSPASAMALSFALIRGITQKGDSNLGNYWSDLFRSVVYVLLPLSFVFSLFLISQGSPQNLSPSQKIVSLEGVNEIIPQGPIASQTAIQILGSNGGGFLEANSAHPYENPTGLTNWMSVFFMLFLPSSFIFLFGRRMKNPKHGLALWVASALLFSISFFLSHFFERSLLDLGWEGKEVRFGIFGSSLFNTAGTASSCGAANAALGSASPFSIAIYLSQMMLGEMVFGGVGSGVMTLILYVILTVFVSGLMVGRTPEFAGKKIEAFEIQWIALSTAGLSFLILGLSTVGLLSQASLPSHLTGVSAHRFTEILYAVTSCVANNGSAMIIWNNPFWNYLLSFAMILGRIFSLVPMIAIAGSLSQKKIHEATDGGFPVEGLLFVILFLEVVLLLQALTYLPILCLGPFAEGLSLIRMGVL